MNKAIFQVHGANCTGCKIAIDHFIKKLDGVSDNYFDTGTNQLSVEYTNELSLDKIVEFIQKIGYDASLIEKE